MRVRRLTTDDGDALIGRVFDAEQVRAARTSFGLDGGPAMTTYTLPDEPNYCFVPAYDIEDEVQQIRIVFENMAGYVPTALVALSIDDAERLCNKLNARLGLTKEQWTALAAKSMRAEAPRPGDRTAHRAATGVHLPPLETCPKYHYVFGQERVMPCPPHRLSEPA